MAKKYHKIGSMIEKRDKQTQEPIRDEDNLKTYYIKIDNNTKIIVNGVAIPPGSFINVKRPYDYDYRQHYVKKVTTEQEYLEKKAQYEGKGPKSFLSFDLEIVTEE